MPYLSYTQVAPRVNELFKLIPGLAVKRAEIVPEGLLFVFESSTERFFLKIIPKVYTEGKNIVDPINDITTLYKVQRQPITATGEEGLTEVGSVELAHSAWLGESFL
jgi:hypothetical protein